MAAATRVLPSPAQTGSAQPPTPIVAPVLDYNCLFTHDLKRKQKRWQDGRLKFHTFNKRVMVYDDRGNFIGDSHWREDYDFDEGEEFQLERGCVIVQVGDCQGSKDQDLTELFDKRRRQKDKGQSASAAAASPASAAATPVRPALQPRQPQGRGSFQSPFFNNGATPIRAPIGRAVIPTTSPFEQRLQQQAQQEQEKEQDSGAAARPAKRRRPEVSPPSKSGYAQSLFGAALSLTPWSSSAQSTQNDPSPPSVPYRAPPETGSNPSIPVQRPPRTQPRRPVPPLSDRPPFEPQQNSSSAPRDVEVLPDTDTSPISALSREPLTRYRTPSMRPPVSVPPSRPSIGRPNLSRPRSNRETPAVAHPEPVRPLSPTGDVREKRKGRATERPVQVRNPDSALLVIDLEASGDEEAEAGDAMSCQVEEIGAARPAPPPRRKFVPPQPAKEKTSLVSSKKRNKKRGLLIVSEKSNARSVPEPGVPPPVDVPPRKDRGRLISSVQRGNSKLVEPDDQLEARNEDSTNGQKLVLNEEEEEEEADEEADEDEPVRPARLIRRASKVARRRTRARSLSVEDDDEESSNSRNRDGSSELEDPPSSDSEAEVQEPPPKRRATTRRKNQSRGTGLRLATLKRSVKSKEIIGFNFDDTHDDWTPDVPFSCSEPTGEDLLAEAIQEPTDGTTSNQRSREGTQIEEDSPMPALPPLLPGPTPARSPDETSSKEGLSQNGGRDGIARCKENEISQPHSAHRSSITTCNPVKENKPDDKVEPSSTTNRLEDTSMMQKQLISSEEGHLREASSTSKNHHVQNSGQTGQTVEVTTDNRPKESAMQTASIPKASDKTAPITECPTTGDADNNPLQRPRIPNPATRNRKAAQKSDAAGQLPQSVVPPPLPMPTIVRPAPKIRESSSTGRGNMPGFKRANGGPWSKQAHDLLGMERPSS